MRLRILSDLHLEDFDEPRALPQSNADIVILAGDIHAGVQGLSWAAEHFAGTPILYVPGNHEFYSTAMPTLRRQLEDEAARLGIHLLDNRTLTLNGIRFHGTTLWTDFALYAGQPNYDPSLTEARALDLMPDFQIIEQPDGAVFTPAESRRLHAKALAWLERELSRPFSGPRVVISHHAPLSSCIPSRYRGDVTLPGFCFPSSATDGPHGSLDSWTCARARGPQCERNTYHRQPRWLSRRVRSALVFTRPDCRGQPLLI